MVGDHERAHALLDTAESRFGATEAVLRARGATYFNGGDVDSALAAYEELLRAQPESAVALNFIAYTLADEGRELGRALEYAELAAELDNDNPLVRDTLGWVYYRVGRLEEARAELERAIELGAVDSVVYDHLGDVLAALGLGDPACESWLRALELSPESDSIRQKIRSTCPSEATARPGEGGADR
jgi:tetratricopeptide (TPR) repeat protein